jgi:CRISPR-associated protein Cmr6
MRESDLRSAKDFELFVCSAETEAGAELPAWNGLPEHVGVWLDRCYVGEKDLDDKDKTRRKELYARAVKALSLEKPAVVTYKAFFERWKRELSQPGRMQRGVLVEIEARTRVLLHPASNASVTDGSVLLHHTYGVPYLPGSGLKGLARAWLRRTVDLQEREERKNRHGETWKEMRSDARDQEILRALFGYIPRKEDGAEARSQGAVVEFLDALWVPARPNTERGHARPDTERGQWSPLALDVVNPHQSSYYTGGEAPSDTNEPVPTHRLSIAPGTRFLVIVECVPMQDGKGAPVDGKAWVDYVLEKALKPALENIGFGAWTSAGYGRFEVPMPTAKAIMSPGRALQASQDTEVWHTATVTLDPGSGKLSALIPGVERCAAEASGAIAKELRARLSPELQERLRNKRSLKLKVRVEPFGNAWRLIELKAL